jgi:phosphopantetheinyl transferase (holo-ACP synthase)/malonyl CoA-acyl carrier protein transacylase
MRLERSEGVLCLIGADSVSALIDEVVRILSFIEKSTALRMIDVVYTATCDAREHPHVVGLWVTSLGEMERKLRFALNALRSGRTRMRDKSGVFFTARPLVHANGKVAFVFPGTGSFHLEMMRDLALTFDGVRQRFDDMEEAFSGFCEVASPSEWLFSTAPEHTLSLAASRDFLPLLASASTYLASKVFADFLFSVGVRPHAVCGVGLGAFSAFHATHHNPKLSLVQILRDAGRLLMQLGTEKTAFTGWSQLTVSGVPIDDLKRLETELAGEMVITQNLTSDDCILVVSPKVVEKVESTISSCGGASVAEPMVVPVNTGCCPEVIQTPFKQFFSRHVSCEPQIPFYSAVDATQMGRSPEAVVEGLTKQMAEPLDFQKMIRQMYDDGCRIFVEVGARGLLTPLISKVLADKTEEPPAVIPMQILHRSGGVQVGQALGLLAAHGVPVDYSKIRFFNHAKRLDFDKPVVDEVSKTLTLRLLRELPAIHPELIDASRILSMQQTVVAEDAGVSHSHALQEASLRGGLEMPLLREAFELSRETNRLELRCILRLEDYPYLNDYAIGTSGVSMHDPQMRGLTLFSVPSGIELMAEVAHRLLPRKVLQKVAHLRSPRWLSFAFGTLKLRVTAEMQPAIDGAQMVKVRIYPEDLTDDGVHAAMEAVFTFGDVVPEPEAETTQPLVSPKPVNWMVQEIYPQRLFQGPLLRNVRKVSGWGYNGLDYEVRIPSQAATVRHTRKPLFSAMPLLLDAVVSGFPLWRSHERFHGAISLPFRCQKIHYYAAAVPAGTRLRCALRLANVTARTFQVDILVTDMSGHLIMKIEGWEEVGGRAVKSLHDFVMNPAKHFITLPLPAAILPTPDAQIIGALYVNETPDFFISNQELWLNALASAVLTANERENYAQMGGVAPRRLEWLLGRTAAKEAVRRLLVQNYNVYESSADITIWKDNLGKPHPLGDWENQVASPIDLTIAHTEGLILGAATAQGRIGLDVESVKRDLTEDFLRGVFTLEEQELATKSGDGPTAVLRFWCAKEAISKALGVGIRFAPTDLKIRDSDPATGMLGMDLCGAWAENFPMFRNTRIPIKTTVLYDHAIACCILPNF